MEDRIRACYRAPGAHAASFAPADADAVRAALAQPDGLLWVDIDSSDRAAAEPLLRDVFRFHQLTIDDCFNAHIDPPKVDDYGDYLFVIVHAVAYDAAARELCTDELNLFVGANYVVSLHQTPLHAVDAVFLRAGRESIVFARGADFLAHALFDTVVDDLHPVVDTLEDQVSALEDAVIEQPHRTVIQDVLRLKHVAQQLRRSIIPQRDIAASFSRGEFGSIVGDSAQMYFRDIYDHTVRVEQMVEGVRDLAESAMSLHLSAVNNRINEVMKALAIVTVIFLPLTLIAGIYGTNFENLPEYGWRYGYPAMLGGMLALALGLVAWFRYRRWL